jgi:hypothetical protein
VKSEKRTETKNLMEPVEHTELNYNRYASPRTNTATSGVSVLILERSFGTKLILSFLRFFKHVEPCIYVCLSSYAKVPPVPENGNLDCVFCS